jgi:hypothetical protein
MDRRELLKNACGLGVCGCAAGLLGVPEMAGADETAGADQRLAFARYQIAKLVGFVAGATPPETCAAILENTGRECARLNQLAARFKGDVDGYFAAIKSAWGTDAAWDKEKGVITVTVPEGPCGCPLVDPARTPALWCNCSVGYGKEAFGTVFGRPVEASLKESKLTGSARCVFEVRLS